MLFSVFMVCSIKLIMLMISLFCCWHPSMMEVVWKFFGRLIGLVIGLQMIGSFLMNLIFSFLFLLVCSMFSWYLNCFFNPSSSVWFVDREGGFSLFLMVSVFSCSIVVFLCWVVFCLTFFLCCFCFAYVLLCQNTKSFFLSRVIHHIFFDSSILVWLVLLSYVSTEEK